MQVNEVTLSDADIDVLKVIHDQIMFYATAWASGYSTLEPILQVGMVISAIHSWDRVAAVLGVPSDLRTEGFKEYNALIGC